MSRFGKLLIIIVLVLGAMLLVTYLVPDIREFAKTLSISSNLPMWLVGLAAPILFLLKKLGGVFGGLLGDSPTERDIRERNEAIKTRLDGLERDVRQLDEWRRTEIEPRRQRIAGFEQRGADMEARARALDANIAAMFEERDQLQSALRDDPDLVP